MQIYYNQLDKQLKDNLKPIYIITGNEVYQEEVCLDKIIKTANNNGFIDHDVIYVEKTFDWNIFDSINANLSLFSEKKIIELRFLTKSVGITAEKKISEYIESYPEDNILIIRLPELKAADFKKKWLGMKDSNVGLIRLYPLTKKIMIEELNNAVLKYNYNINKECINYIADMYEGNMIAANQALIKIDLMIKDDVKIDLKFLNKVFSKDVDFEANNLVDYSIEGNISKIETCISFLKDNNYPVQYIIWSYIRSFRTILFNFDSLNSGKTKEDILRNVWPYERKNLMSYSLTKLSVKKIESYLGVLIRIDMQSKNVIDGNIWDSIYDLSVSVAKNKLSVIKYS